MHAPRDEVNSHTRLYDEAALTTPLTHALFLANFFEDTAIVQVPIVALQRCKATTVNRVPTCPPPQHRRTPTTHSFRIPLYSPKSSRPRTHQRNRARTASSEMTLLFQASEPDIIANDVSHAKRRYAQGMPKEV
jgi:hypothetical protein